MFFWCFFFFGNSDEGFSISGDQMGKHFSKRAREQACPRRCAVADGQAP